MHETTKKTLVIGASVNPERYAYKAIHLLTQKGYPVVALGNREGETAGIKITKNRIQYPDIHTVTMYINPTIQKEYYEYILSLHPQRIIFNPGTENPELARLAADQDIQTEEACTLVLLNLGQY
ncbi:MAG: CoA-binding protein [Chitinophagales bacterium]|nr:CoA-binding protein [Chitinophagales bacterium]